jgi:hypothetical protein
MRKAEAPCLPPTVGKVEQTWLAPTDIGAINREVQFSTSLGYCEMAERIVCGIRQALKNKKSPLRSILNKGDFFYKLNVT